MYARLAFAALGGVAASAAFAPLAWWPMALISVTILVAVVRGTTLPRAAAFGAVFGAFFMGPHTLWAYSLGGVVPWAGLTLSQVPMYAIFGVAIAALWRLPTAWAAPLTPAVWVLGEAIKSRFPFGGFSWGRLAFSQSESPLLGVAGVLGAPALTAAVAAVGAGLLAAAARSWISAAALLTVPWLIAVAPTGLEAPTGTLRVAAVQGTTPGVGLGYYLPRGETLRRHAELTASYQGDAEVLIWPESGADLDPLRSAKARATVEAAANAVEVPLLIGTTTRDGDAVFNTVLQWDPAAGPTDSYHKRGIVPFGEYIPWRGFFESISPLVRQVTTDFTAGSKVGTFEIADATIGPVICFEVAKDALVNSTVDAGADILVIPINTAQFGYSAESAQQVEMARVRAVEYGRSVVNVSTIGQSALIMPDGAVITRSSIGTQQILEADLPLHKSVTFGATVGFPVELILIIVGLLGVTVGYVSSRKEKTT